MASRKNALCPVSLTSLIDHLPDANALAEAQTLHLVISKKKNLKCTGAHLSHPCYYLSLISEVVLVCVLEEKFPQCFRTRIQPHRGLCCMPTSCIQHQNGIKATCSPCSTGRQVQIHTQLLLETPHTLPSVFSSAFQINWVSQFNLVKQTVTDFLNAANEARS